MVWKIWNILTRGRILQQHCSTKLFLKIKQIQLFSLPPAVKAPSSWYRRGSCQICPGKSAALCSVTSPRRVGGAGAWLPHRAHPQPLPEELASKAVSRFWARGIAGLPTRSLNSLSLSSPAGCPSQRRMDPLRSHPGGNPRQPSRQRRGRGGGAVGLEGEREQRPPPPEQQLSPAEDAGVRCQSQSCCGF